MKRVVLPEVCSGEPILVNAALPVPCPAAMPADGLLQFHK